MGKYTVELVNSSGTLLADLSGRAMSRRVTASRNEACEIDWTLDLDEFENYCRLINQDPRNLLIPGSTEVRIRRLGEYLQGGQLVYSEPRLTASGNNINLKATGFLNLFKDRYTSAERDFTATDASAIASTLISESQALTNGDFGVSIGTLATVGNHDRTYKRTNLKNALQDLTKLQTGSFDMEFTYNKVFNTYTAIGSSRPEIIFEYPHNIKEITVPNDGTGIANEVIALGAGIGVNAGTQVTVDDIGSQLSYRLRQNVITVNGTTDADGGVTDAANSELHAWAFPYEIPVLTVDGNVAPFITDYGIGDRVRIRIKNHKIFAHIDGLYRIEKYELAIDEADNESVKLYVTI